MGRGDVRAGLCKLTAALHVVTSACWVTLDDPGYPDAGATATQQVLSVELGEPAPPSYMFSPLTFIPHNSRRPNPTIPAFSAYLVTGAGPG